MISIFISFLIIVLIAVEVFVKIKTLRICIVCVIFIFILFASVEMGISIGKNLSIKEYDDSTKMALSNLLDAYTQHQPDAVYKQKMDILSEYLPGNSTNDKNPTWLANQFQFIDSDARRLKDKPNNQPASQP